MSAAATTTITTPASQTDLNISLEPHLAETLRKLAAVLPPELASRLNLIIEVDDSSPSPRVIPYSLLSSISSWARSTDGSETLREHSPPLNPGEYSMISLLAGTRTSPERRLPAMQAVRTPLEDAQRQVSDRRAVTAVVNALLSVGGAGAATWWAAGRLSWKDEWKVLLSFFVAAVVAISEAVLYVIWDARRSQTSRGPHPTLRFKSSKPSYRQKRVDGSPGPSDSAVLAATSTATAPQDRDGQTLLRERNVSATPDSSLSS